MKIITTTLSLLLLISCNSAKPFVASDYATIGIQSQALLPIPNLLQDPDSPDGGWCGEASIQMGLRYYHKDVSQKEINKAGNPSHPDLYSDDINQALKTLHMKYIEWDDNNQNLPQYVSWIKTNISKGYPVFCGMKINPTRHPLWSLDHFVLAVGYNDKGLFINTNHDDGQLLITYEQLASTTNHYSFENRYHYYFGRALTGFEQ